jgi:hypothetical protein
VMGCQSLVGRPTLSAKIPYVFSVLLLTPTVAEMDEF